MTFKCCGKRTELTEQKCQQDSEPHHAPVDPLWLHPESEDFGQLVLPSGQAPGPEDTSHALQMSNLSCGKQETPLW